MRKYLSTLHHRPVHHRRRFALLVSGIFTLLIFSVWSLVMFGDQDGGIVADKKEDSNVASPLTGIKKDLGQIKEAVSNIYGGQE